MPARALDIGEMEAVLASIEADCLAAPAVMVSAPAQPRFDMPDVPMPALPEQIADSSGATTEDGSCLRAFGFALVLEAAAAAFLFGLWQLWRFVH